MVNGFLVWMGTSVYIINVMHFLTIQVMKTAPGRIVEPKSGDK